MELISVTVQGLKKFAEIQTLKTEGKLVAILGPNESGKTSLLKGISRAVRYGSFDTGDMTWDLEPPTIEVVATFQLSEDDRALGDVRHEVRLLKLIKRSENSSQYTLVPWPERDKSARFAIRSSVGSIFHRKWVHDNVRDEELLKDSLRKIAELSERNDEDFTEDDITILQSTASAIRDNLRSENQPRPIAKFISELDEFVNSERKTHPHRTIYGALRPRIPEIYYLSDEDREIADYYSFAELAAAKQVPKGLGNLLRLAGVDLAALLQAHAEARKTDVRTILERANASLRERLSPFWSQGQLEARLNYDDSNLNIGIVEKDGRHSDLSQRSDGLRQFMALVAFLGVGHSATPIVLIDEIERNLHYDAQADLIQVLERQSAASKIIYTTHSAGALPSDLGRGVHLIKADPKTSRRSRIENRFWSLESSSGFQPLLIGLGASTLAFFPTRRAVICEGPSEMLLLPAMFREVSERIVDFQVVPGLASVSETRVPALAANAKRVAYMTDSDAAGNAIVEKLLTAGVDSKNIIQLRTNSTTGFTLEDFISPAVLIGAAKRYLARYSDAALELAAADFGTTGRIAQIKQAMENSGMTGFSKVDLAYDILDVVADQSTNLVEGKYRSTLARTCRRLEAILTEAVI